MSEHTLRSLSDLIRSNRSAREENLRTMEKEEPLARPWWRAQIALFDEAYRDELAHIEELPTLLQYAMRLQEGWPYPTDEALEVFRAQVAHLARRPMHEVDQLPLREILAILEGHVPRVPPPDVVSNGYAKGIAEVKVSRLPRWARVAFVAHCARRVQRVLVAEAPNPEAEELSGIDRAIAAAERSAGAGKPEDGIKDIAESVFRRANSQLAPNVPYGSEAKDVPLYDQLRYAVGNAAALAARACLTADSKPPTESFHHSRGAAFTVGSTTALDGMRRDWNHLTALAERSNWNDQTPVPAEQMPVPRIRLVGLHVRGLRAIEKFDLPGHGLGWGEKVPDLILLGGVNGSGKTTLLEFFTEAFQALTRPLTETFVRALPWALDAREAWADFVVEAYEFPRAAIRFLIGDDSFVQRNSTDNCWYFRRTNDAGAYFGIVGNGLTKARATISEWFPNTAIPSVLFFPSDDRTLVVPPEGYKSAGKLATSPEFVYRWRRPAQWKDSLEAVLYSTRWEDLNARAEGRFTEFGSFEAYAEAFRRFSGNLKNLAWEQAELVVRIANGAIRHDLADLSSGEKQMLLISGEILRRWRAGSLVMIDEPELHLHSTWQTKLYEALRYWQAERGGQVILATQSSHLFHIAEPGTAALLGVDTL